MKIQPYGVFACFTAVLFLVLCSWVAMNPYTVKAQDVRMISEWSKIARDAECLDVVPEGRTDRVGKLCRTLYVDPHTGQSFEVNLVFIPASQQ